MAELSKALVECGHEVNVLTVTPILSHPVYKFDFAEMRHVHHKVNIHRVPMGPINRLTSRTLRGFSVPGTRNNKVKLRSASLSPKTSPRISIAERLYGARKFLQPLLIPDANFDWIPAALLEARRILKRDRYDIVASFGYPHSNHLVAYLALRKREVCWVMMHAEGWGTSPGVEELPKWSAKAHRALERKCSLKAARIVVCNADGLAKRLQETYGVSTKKLWSAQLAFAERPSSESKSEIAAGFHLVFTGTFYPETGQDPRELFDAIKSLGSGHLRLSILGPVSVEFESYVKARSIPDVEFLGWCSRDDALRHQQGAKVLLVYGHKGGQQVPSKIYEYLGACRPILCIAADDEDLTARLVSLHNRGIVVPNSLEHIREALLTLECMEAEGTLDSVFNLEELPQYTPARSGEQLMRAVLGEILNPVLEQQQRNPGFIPQHISGL
jgi:glycosyltransferase involved in cell wall biosynthesis